MSMSKINNYSARLLMPSLLALVGFALSSAPAYAGFEWVAPGNSPSASSSTISTNNYGLSPAPIPLSPAVGNSASPMSDVISPVVISGDAQNRAGPQVLMPPPSTQPMKSYNRNSDMPENMATSTIDTVPTASPPQPSNDIVQGFATQVPLTLALRQILPPGYNFSIDQDVSMDTPVSYSGGKPWRQTLTQMLSSVGLMGRELGNTYSISHTQQSSAPVTSAPVISDASPDAGPFVSNDDDTEIHNPAPSAGSPVMHSSFAPPAPQIVTVGVPVAAPAPFTMSSGGGSGDEWSAERGETLRKVLTAWCGKANIELQWMTEYDYPIEGSAHFNSSFEDAVRGLLAGFDSARPQPIGELHSSTAAGQKVLVVQARGNNYTN